MGEALDCANAMERDVRKAEKSQGVVLLSCSQSVDAMRGCARSHSGLSMYAHSRVCDTGSAQFRDAALMSACHAVVTARVAPEPS